jgi:hypothetical protein
LGVGDSSIEAMRCGTKGISYRKALSGHLSDRASDEIEPQGGGVVKCRWNLGCLSSQFRTFLCLWTTVVQDQVDYPALGYLAVTELAIHDRGEKDDAEDDV